MYKTVATWWAEPPLTKSGSPKVVGRNGSIVWFTVGMVQCTTLYRKNTATLMEKRTAD